MPNRAMQAKVVKAKAEATEYAIQASYTELAAPRGEYQMIRGKLVPRPAPVTLESLKADHAAKIIAQRALALATREALGKRTKFAWSRT